MIYTGECECIIVGHRHARNNNTVVRVSAVVGSDSPVIVLDRYGHPLVGVQQYKTTQPNGVVDRPIYCGSTVEPTPRCGYSLYVPTKWLVPINENPDTITNEETLCLTT